MTYPSNTTLITLSRPLKLNGEDIETIQMREPTVFDKLLFEKNKGAALEKEVAMIAGLCSLNPGDLHQLPAYDYDQLTEAFNDFFAATGGALEPEFLNNQPGITYWCRITFSEQLTLPLSIWRRYLKKAIKQSAA